MACGNKLNPGPLAQENTDAEGGMSPAKMLLQYPVLYQLDSCSTTQKVSSVSDNGKSDWRIMLHTYKRGFQTLQLAQRISGVAKAVDFNVVLCPSCSHGSKYLLDKREKISLQ